MSSFPTKQVDRRASERPLILLVGNPNSGKTTLFNELTGSRQKVANYPGVTVERSLGTWHLRDTDADIVDLPGLYSLVPISEDEHVALEAILHGIGEQKRPDLVLLVIDASNLERNLFLANQLIGTGLPVVTVLTMTDRVASLGKSLDSGALERALARPLVRVQANRKHGIVGLARAVDDVLAGTDLGRVLPSSAADSPESISETYAWASKVASSVLLDVPDAKRRQVTQRIDAVLTHRVFGLVVFAALMYLVFLSIYTLAQPLMNGIGALFTLVASGVSSLFGFAPMLRSALVDGLIRGLSSVTVFLPQIAILFFFIAILEGSGYLARAAFLMDRLLGWCGLSGRAFIPLLSSFACAIPGILAARVMPDSRSRLGTILVAPLMSCSARLPVYVVLIGAIIQPRYGVFWASFALFGMYLLGLIVAVPIAWIFNRKLMRGKRLPFVLELPPYQFPRWKDAWITVATKAKSFVHTAGTIIVVMSIAIWAFTYFPRLSNARAGQIALAHRGQPKITIDAAVASDQLANSILGRFGQAIEPAFKPAGFDWRITTSILAAFPARETMVPSMGILFHIGKNVDESSSSLQKAISTARGESGGLLFTPATTISLMIFFALCCQCMGTLATVKKETGTWKWPIVMFLYMTALAYIGAVSVQLVARWF